jgi:VanZ family protein
VISAKDWSALSSGASLLLRSLPALAWMLAIAYSSQQTRPLGRGVAAPLDSLAHFAEYAILFALVWLAAKGFRYCRNQPNAALIVAAAVCVPFAASDELHQVFVRGRSGSATDLGMDIAGMIASAVLLRSAEALQQMVSNASAGAKSTDHRYPSSQLVSRHPDMPSQEEREQ